MIAIPATIDGNVRRKYIESDLGFDTASKVYSQLIGNMMTDAASAVKYWYFIRLMGKDPSHLALECALQTEPNMVIVSEDCAMRGEALPKIVENICDLIAERAALKKNFGTILIPEGLLSHLPHLKQLIEELNEIFKNMGRQEAEQYSAKLVKNPDLIREQLSPWSAAIFNTLPDFTKKQFLMERDERGAMQLS